MPYGQVVIGPPGSGKTTYCNGMQQFLTATKRPVSVVNLDPANENLSYDCAVNISELITLDEAMKKQTLGPNGGMVHCIEHLEQNLIWLQNKLTPLEDRYLLFDFPGQVELYTHHESMRNILSALEKWGFQLCVVHLIDSHHCNEPAKYISAVMLSLSAMMSLSLPHINVISKIDLLQQYGKLDFNLDTYIDAPDLTRLAEKLDEDPLTKRFADLNKAICDVVHDYGLVAFSTLDIQDRDSVYSLVKKIDRASGYVFGALEPANDSIMESAQGIDVPKQEEDLMRQRINDSLGDDDAEIGVYKFCAVCGDNSELLRCGGCHLVYYCSKEHQQSHWSKHKTRCKFIQQHNELHKSRKVENVERNFDPAEPSGGEL